MDPDTVGFNDFPRRGSWDGRREFAGLRMLVSTKAMALMELFATHGSAPQGQRTQEQRQRAFARSFLSRILVDEVAQGIGQ